MDTLRGTFDAGDPADRGWDVPDEDTADTAAHRDSPPDSIGQDERRMQVRAYNHWASLLGDSLFPDIADLDLATLPDFGPHSVLLDFSMGIDNPAVRFLGAKLAQECGEGETITQLSDVPPRSLLSRITDHYMQILANQAPIGFEAEFVNQRGQAILYRGILLPYSSKADTIDFILGVINWKEMADQLTADELLLEIDQALDLSAEMELGEPARRAADPVTDWADSPAHEDDAAVYAELTEFAERFATIAPFTEASEDDLALPDFAQFGLEDDEEYDEDGEEDDGASYSFASLADYIEAPVKKAIDPAQFTLTPLAPDSDDFAADHGDFVDPAAGWDEEQDHEPAPAAPLASDADLYDCLASARELARAADTTEDRSRSALYAAVGRAYDFSLAAQAEPEAFAALVAESGLTMQDRAPMTPVVKLVFGHDYDKTRLTEYAAVLTHAHRLKLERGTLATFLGAADGGLKAVVKAERRMRREEQGKPVEDAAAVREALAEQLRALDAIMLEELDGAGPEFALVMIRRDEIGCAHLIAELPEDVAQIERAARRMFG